METTAILSEINQLYQKAIQSLQQKDLEIYSSYFNNDLKYVLADGQVFDKKSFINYLENQFKSTKILSLEYYSIKASQEGDILTEKIAKKIVSKVNAFILFSKKQTIQTEEIFKWRNDNGKWKIFEVEITLEEKY
jgi:ABC-type transporter MlaC component